MSVILSGSARWAVGLERVKRGVLVVLAFMTGNMRAGGRACIVRGPRRQGGRAYRAGDDAGSALRQKIFFCNN